MGRNKIREFEIDNVYQEHCGDLSAELSEQIDLIYADIIYDAWEEVPIEALVCTLKPGGALFLQTDYRSIAQAKLTLDKLLMFNNWIIWPYDWGGRPKDAFGRKHDDILYYIKPGTKHTFNAEAVSVKKTVMIRSTKDWKIPTDVWADIGNFYTTSKERIRQNGRSIAWQKPEALIERIILVASNRGDIIFEPYLGTGTACAVAKRLGRHFVGCDIRSDMVKIAKKRLNL